MERSNLRADIKKARRERRDRKAREETDCRFGAEVPDDIHKAVENEFRREAACKENDRAANKILKRLNPKPPPKGRRHQAVIDLDKASIRGGFKSQKRGRRRRGSECIGFNGPASLGYRFSDNHETPDRLKARRTILVDYGRRKTIKEFGPFTNDTLAQMLGVNERTVRRLRKEINDPGRYHEDLELAMEVLRAMATGAIASVIRTSHDDEARALYATIANAGRTIEPNNAGRKYGGVISIPMSPEDAGLFDKLKAAFLIEYDVWRLERKAWPRKTDGSERANSRKNGGKRTA